MPGTPTARRSLIGSATGTASFDLSGSGLASTRYLRIRGPVGRVAESPYAGMDLDAITVLHGTTAVWTRPGRDPTPLVLAESVPHG